MAAAQGERGLARHDSRAGELVARGLIRDHGRRGRTSRSSLPSIARRVWIREPWRFLRGGSRGLSREYPRVEAADRLITCPIGWLISIDARRPRILRKTGTGTIASVRQEPSGRRRERVPCKRTDRCAQAVTLGGSGSRERGSTRDGRKSDRKGKRKRRIVHGTDPENLNAQTDAVIGCDLPLCMEMADRAIVSPRCVLVALPRRLPMLRGESIRAVPLAR